MGIKLKIGRQRRDLTRSQRVLLTRFARCAGRLWQGSNPPMRSATHADTEQRSHLLALLAVLFVAESARGGTERRRRREGRGTPGGVPRNLNPDETRFARLV